MRVVEWGSPSAEDDEDRPSQDTDHFTGPARGIGALVVESRLTLSASACHAVAISASRPGVELRGFAR